MKIIDGIKLKGRPVEIPDCSRDDLPQFLIDSNLKTGVEIGVHKGEFSEKFCEAGLNLYAIDPWENYEDYQNTRGQNRMDFLYEHTKRTLSHYPNCTIIRKTSMEALNDFDDESLDFVYIDGNHLLKYVIEDITEWSKKVRNNGIISGHDYFYPKARSTNVVHVPYALSAYLDAYNIENWYVLGSKEIIPGEKRDRWRSWMFFKHYSEPSAFVKF